jgi:hypothetical protein
MHTYSPYTKHLEIVIEHLFQVLAKVTILSEWGGGAKRRGLKNSQRSQTQEKDLSFSYG